MNNKNNTPPHDVATVLLGSTEPALAAARDLARRGVRVIAVHFGEGRPPMASSRWLELKNAPPLEAELAVVAWLRELAAELGGKPVLLPTLDRTVALLHRRRAELADCYRFYVWESPLLAELGSKVGLGRVAERYGLPVPRTVSPVTRADVLRAAAELRFPCIVKPEFTNAWWTPAAAALGLDRKAIEVASVEQLLGVWARSERLGARVVIQEKIVGPDSEHMSYFVIVAPDGARRGEMVAQKLRVHPPRFGVGCYAVASERADALAVGRDVVERLGYRGFASVQLKRDTRDGKLHLVEINLRLPLLSELAIRAGRSFPFYYYSICLGADFVESPLRVGQAWMSLRRDFSSMRTYAREGTVAWACWCRDLLRRPAFPVFRWDDPAPAIVASWQWLLTTVRRGGRVGPVAVANERRASRVT
jgi:predicted ATP-grasp superfamily ATP-dependent carboligase